MSLSPIFDALFDLLDSEESTAAQLMEIIALLIRALAEIEVDEAAGLPSRSTGVLRPSVAFVGAFITIGSRGISIILRHHPIFGAQFSVLPTFSLLMADH